jgi:hypothetical protein
MTAARRLAAILVADVVGYSRLMGEDEARTAGAREAPRPIVGLATASASLQRSAAGCRWSFSFACHSFSLSKRGFLAASKLSVSRRSSPTTTGFEWGLRTHLDEEENGALHWLRKTKSSSAHRQIVYSRILAKGNQ